MPDPAAVAALLAALPDRSPEPGPGAASPNHSRSCSVSRAATRCGAPVYRHLASGPAAHPGREAGTSDQS
ncbi:MAG: hypothetical protein ACRDOH_36595 [Streptosporangiaceae bacterium]